MSKATLTERAKGLRDRAADAQNAPFYDRAKLANDLINDLADFLQEVAERVDALTPYADEIESFGGSA